MFIEKKMTPYQIGVHILEMRKKYLMYTKWFEESNSQSQKKFLTLCKNFILSGRTKRNQMIEISFEIASLCDDSDGSSVLQFATQYEVNGFLGIRYAATMTFLRVFYEKKGFSTFETFFVNDCKKGVNGLYALQLDNLMYWSALAQARVSTIIDDCQKNKAKEAILKFSQESKGKKFTRKFGSDLIEIQKLYLDLVAPVLGENIPVLIDYFGDNPSNQYRYTMFDGPHDMREINILCLLSLIEVINGKDPILIEDQNITHNYFN